MMRKATVGLLLVAALVGAGPASATTRLSHHAHAGRHHARHVARRDPGYGYGQAYASPVSPTPTCRYADGTPYDPDIIGGVNHVGDGGPAANLGGFNPCGD